MSETKSERVAREAFQDHKNGDLRGFIHRLIDFADQGIRNKKTEQAFKNAIDKELSKFDVDVVKPEEDAPQCCHCGSTSTWWRSDGDVSCNNCPGIMPMNENPEQTSPAEG